MCLIAVLYKYFIYHCRDLKHIVEGIEEGWREKQRQRSSRLFGGRIYSIPCRASCFASVDLEEMVEFILFLFLSRHPKTSHFKNIPDTASRVDFLPSRQ